MKHALHGDGLASAALLGLPVMELLDGGDGFVVAAIIVVIAPVALAWVLR